MSNQVARRTADRVVEQCGVGLADRTGCVTENITTAQYDALVALLAAPNGGVTLNADGSFTAIPPTAPAPIDPQIALDAQAVKDYLAAATPTAAQTGAALRALGRGRTASSA